MIGRLPPNFTLLCIVGSTIAMILIFLIDQGGVYDVPEVLYTIYFGILGFIFFWWPVDMLIHWEKRTLAAEAKDRWLAAASLTASLFIFPFFFVGTPFLPTLGVAVAIGLSVPATDWLRHRARRMESAIDAESVYQIAMESKHAQTFGRYFPDPNLYAIGLNAADGALAHFLMHKRQPCDEAPGYFIDYVMDISVDRDVGVYITNKERLHCYIFRNHEGKAYIGMLPSTNIGRALDFGFTDEEIERAVYDADSHESNFPALGDEPLMVKRFSGKVVKM